MNPVYQEYAGTIARFVMIFGGPLLARYGLGETEVSAVIGALVALVGLVWGIIQKYKARTKLVVALAAPAGTTEAAVDATVRSNVPLPPVSTPKTEVATLTPAAALTIEAAKKP